MNMDEMMDAINKVAWASEQLDENLILCVTKNETHYEWVVVERVAFQKEKGKPVIVKRGPLYNDEQNLICELSGNLMDSLIVQFHAFNYVFNMGR